MGIRNEMAGVRILTLEEENLRYRQQGTEELELIKKGNMFAIERALEAGVITEEEAKLYRENPLNPNVFELDDITRCIQEAKLLLDKALNLGVIGEARHALSSSIRDHQERHDAVLKLLPQICAKTRGLE